MKKYCIHIFFLMGGLWLLGAPVPDKKVAPEEPKEPPPRYGWTADDFERKLKVIRIPELEFFQVPLPEALNTLQTLSIKHDPEAKTNPQLAGVQFVLLTRGNPPPKVTLKLRNASLGSILGFVVEMVGYEYDLRNAAIAVYKRKPISPEKQSFRRLETDFFKLSEDMIRKLGGR